MIRFLLTLPCFLFCSRLCACPVIGLLLDVCACSEPLIGLFFMYPHVLILFVVNMHFLALVSCIPCSLFLVSWFYHELIDAICMFSDACLEWL